MRRRRRAPCWTSAVRAHSRSSTRRLANPHPNPHPDPNPHPNPNPDPNQGTPTNAHLLGVHALPPASQASHVVALAAGIPESSLCERLQAAAIALAEDFSARGIPCRACFRPSVVITQASGSSSLLPPPYPTSTSIHTQTHTHTHAHAHTQHPHPHRHPHYTHTTPNPSPASHVPVQVTCPDRTAAAALAARPELIPAPAASSIVSMPRHGLSCDRAAW